MAPEEQDKTLGRLVREHRTVVEKRLYVTERVKQISDALNRLARAINRKPDFDEVSRDSILQEYLDLSKIGALVIEEQELSAQQLDYEKRIRALGFEPFEP